MHMLSLLLPVPSFSIRINSPHPITQSRELRLQRLPELLCISLKRFAYSASRGASVKIDR